MMEDDSSASNPIQLPPSIWASICSNYLPYEDVLSLSAVNQTFLRKVSPRVQRLYVLHPNELHVIPARRYYSVDSIYVYCLVQFDDEEEDCLTLEPDAVIRLVPFLECFPNLEYAFVGGMCDVSHDYASWEVDGTHVDLRYGPSECITDGHEVMFLGLVRAVCGAYLSGSLPENATMDGIISGSQWRQFDCDYEHIRNGSYCNTCMQVCRSYPLHTLLAMTRKGQPKESMYYGNICVSDKTRFEIMSRRRGGTELLGSSVSIATLLKYTCNERIEDKEDGTVFAKTFPEDVLTKMRLLCEDYGCDAKKLTRQEIIDCMFSHFSDTTAEKRYIMQDIFIYLKSLGLDLHEEDWVVMDESRVGSSFCFNGFGLF